jgi:predicted DNA-binding transcriptional regulator AlpA
VTKKLRRVLRFPAVMEATGFSRPHIYYLMATDPDFPKSFKLHPDGQATGFFEDELVQYQAKLAASREGR